MHPLCRPRSVHHRPPLVPAPPRGHDCEPLRPRCVRVGRAVPHPPMHRPGDRGPGRGPVHGESRRAAGVAHGARQRSGCDDQLGSARGVHHRVPHQRLRQRRGQGRGPCPAALCSPHGRGRPPAAHGAGDLCGGQIGTGSAPAERVAAARGALGGLHSRGGVLGALAVPRAPVPPRGGAPARRGVLRLLCGRGGAPRGPRRARGRRTAPPRACGRGGRLGQLGPRGLLWPPGPLRRAHPRGPVGPELHVRVA
mmetsp:Transcript_20756/g.69623  ORF Transcript_20756/g.69623 Transcript_20756/m.69623 type:complete len:252 (+) Transcript_20756:337-1092(+)